MPFFAFWSLTPLHPLHQIFSSCWVPIWSLLFVFPYLPFLFSTQAAIFFMGLSVIIARVSVCLWAFLFSFHLFSCCLYNGPCFVIFVFGPFGPTHFYPQGNIDAKYFQTPLCLPFGFGLWSFNVVSLDIRAPFFSPLCALYLCVPASLLLYLFFSPLFLFLFS